MTGTPSSSRVWPRLTTMFPVFTRLTCDSSAGVPALTADGRAATSRVPAFATAVLDKANGRPGRKN